MVELSEEMMATAEARQVAAAPAGAAARPKALRRLSHGVSRRDNPAGSSTPTERHSAMLRDQHARVRAEYKTVKAVNGPLVILEDVKVRSRFRHICVHLDNALTSGLPGLCASAVPQVR